jgi:NAD(P)-dependent dehydrogenase (short-subunit alcohol dehydrogenase family)
MKKQSSQKIAIVTGGASGIGKAIAERFIADKIKTIIIGRDMNKLDAVRKQFGSLCQTISFDLTDISGIPVLIKDIIKKYGHIDILVNNAGINLKKEFTEVTDEEFQKILLTNVTAVFAISREVVKDMETRKSGSIINISSMASQYGLPKVIAYTASKSAIEGMTRAMAVELSPKGIRVNCIAPGFIATDMSAKALNNDKERKQKVLSRTPMGYMGDPVDVANAALYLANGDAKYVTGVVLPVDGGNSIGF